ncbi:MAG: hypothetical protein QNJ35_10210 [Paracoccaceae bacterium]|nr:hypothetical protein [Paracoccaceae bacterium]
MSTWTFKGLALTAALLLAGCAEGFNATRSAPVEVRLPDGLIISGARGWCVDTSTTRTRGDAAVVVFGSCAAIARNALLPRPGVPGVITVSVESAEASAPPADLLEDFFATEEGRAALARDGEAESVRILETRREGEALLIHAVDRSGVPAEAAEDYWRALFDVNGRFVTVSLISLAEDPVSRAAGLATLEAQMSLLRAENGA